MRLLAYSFSRKVKEPAQNFSRSPKVKARVRTNPIRTNSTGREDRNKQHRDWANPEGRKNGKPLCAGGSVFSAGEFWLPFDAFFALYSLLIRVFDFGDFGNDIGNLKELRRSITARENHIHTGRHITHHLEHINYRE